MSEPDRSPEALAPMNGSSHPHTQPDTQPNKPGEAGDVASALQGLVDIQDHEDIERNVSEQVKAAAVEEENKKDEARISNLRSKIQKLKDQKASLVTQKEQKEKARVPRPQLNILSTKISSCSDTIADHIDEIAAFEERIEERNKQQAAAVAAAADKPQLSRDGQTHNSRASQQEGEDRQAFLIRTGKITPFAGLGGADESADDGPAQATVARGAEAEGFQTQTSHQVLRQPGFAPTRIREPIRDDGTAEPTPSNLESEFGLRERKKKRPRTSTAEAEVEVESSDAGPRPVKRVKRKRRARLTDDDAEYTDDVAGSEASESEATDFSASAGRKPAKRVKRKRRALVAGVAGSEASASEATEVSTAGEQPKHTIKLSIPDDANTSIYQARLDTWVQERRELRESLGEVDPAPDEEEWFKPTPGKPDKVVLDDYSLPEEIHDFLFPFQRVGIKWLAQLHGRREGGVLCDEMGLGKTVQIISFLAALHHSNKLDGPAIIVAPATLIAQWVKHFHTWWPPLRVSILHSTGSGMMNPKVEDDVVYSSKVTKKTGAAKKIINNVLQHGHILVTTYRGLHTYIDELAHIEWSYAALDEGHQIRNRNTDASKACKQLNTWHRIIMSGTPVQNNLRELFSLFEFVYPGLLGSDLREFTEHFEGPIRDGHHRGASSLAIATGDRCSNTLRETVRPYMLRRIKADVADSLPPKTEQVLFCKLTPEQENIYTNALETPEVRRVFSAPKNRSAVVFSAIDMLRKICNHPDLRERNKDFADWGNPDRSVKMQVLVELIRVSKKFGHKTLVFSQVLDVLTIMERFLKSENLNYVRMDGRTPQGERHHMVDRFNNSADLDVFLLTPQTGGVGLNLTGADRVILFDPSWNPATDRQAVERAWRLGQTKPVKIYRLLTPGTIEEKMYRKQLYKQFVSDKVMSDTEFNRYVDTSNLRDIFTYGSESAGNTMFDDTTDYQGNSPEKRRNGRQQQPRQRQEPAAEGPIKPEGTELDALNQVRAVEEYTEEGAEEKDMLEAVITNNVDVVHEHEDVLASKHRVRADKKLTEQEADRLNERTVRFLRDQQERAHMERNGGPGGDKAKAPPGRGIGSKAREWTLGSTKKKLVDFLKKRGRKADTGSIVSYFNREYPDVPNDLFKRALSTTTTKEDGPRGKTIWKLKSNL